MKKRRLPPGFGSRTRRRDRGREAGLGVPGHRKGTAEAAHRGHPDAHGPGSPVTISRAAADDFFNAPDWRPDLHPPMPKVVQYGDKETQVRACGSCHLPTGNGHDEFAYVAGLPVGYFMRQMADWKSGERKYGGIMVRSQRPRPTIEGAPRPNISPRSSRVHGSGWWRPTPCRRASSAPATSGWNRPPAAASRWATASSRCRRTRRRWSIAIRSPGSSPMCRRAASPKARRW